MVREYGAPTLFLTLSCAEYESLEISRYLRKVMHLSMYCPTYPRTGVQRGLGGDLP